ncbi:unnamed protein product [Jaminaea pallidilutea]
MAAAGPSSAPSTSRESPAASRGPEKDGAKARKPYTRHFDVRLADIVTTSPKGRKAMRKTTKTLGVTRKRVYWFFDPFTGRDLNSCYRDSIEPQVWHRKNDINGNEQRRAERNRYDSIVLEMTELCKKWQEHQQRLADKEKEK